MQLSKGFVPNVNLLLCVIFFFSFKKYIMAQWVPHGVEVERWLCIPRVSGSIPGTGNLEKVVYLDEN